MLDRYRKWRGKNLRPGQKCPVSGVYRQTGLLGAKTMAIHEATVVRGEPMPPTTLPDRYWTLVDAANVNEAEA